MNFIKYHISKFARGKFIALSAGIRKEGRFKIEGLNPSLEARGANSKKKGNFKKKKSMR